MSRRWSPRKERVNHADDWLMTYADMITLLLCFFAIFLSLSMPKKDIPPKVDMPPGALEPIKPVDILEGNLPFHGLPVARQPTDNEDERIAAAPPPPPMPERDESLKASGEATEPAPQAVVAVPPPPAAPSAALPAIVGQMQAEGSAHVEEKGDRITTIQLSSAPFFAVGSATLSESGKSILQAVAQNLKSDQYKDYQITIEGHTDDSPINTPQFPSNWELSTGRASAVVHFFLEQGIPAQKLRAAGYADTFPLAPNRDANGNPIPSNQAQNRRVMIKLEKIEKAQ